MIRKHDVSNVCAYPGTLQRKRLVYVVTRMLCESFSTSVGILAPPSSSPYIHSVISDTERQKIGPVELPMIALETRDVLNERELSICPVSRRRLRVVK